MGTLPWLLAILNYKHLKEEVKREVGYRGGEVTHFDINAPHGGRRKKKRKLIIGVGKVPISMLDISAP